jgi:hypothetical protein
MNRRIGTALLFAVAIGVGTASAQSTGTPAFAAPYRAFDAHEFGGTLSFPEGGGFAAEGLFGFGSGKFDIGIRGGFWNPDGGDTRILAGVNLRQRVLEHSETFPLDGAVVFGIGGRFVEDFSTLLIPVGLSLGRRLDVEDSQVSIVPFVQPTAFLTTGSSQDTELHFALGIGGDFRLSRMFDARISIGLGDIEGISISAVWLR